MLPGYCQSPAEKIQAAIIRIYTKITSGKRGTYALVQGASVASALILCTASSPIPMQGCRLFKQRPGPGNEKDDWASRKKLCIATLGYEPLCPGT